jgi:hypothetical protein
LLTPDPRGSSWSEPADRGGPETTIASESSPVGGQLRRDETTADGAQAQGTVLQFPDLGIRMELFGKLLALRPDLPDSRVTDTAPLSNSDLGEVYTQVLVALGGSGR